MKFYGLAKKTGRNIGPIFGVFITKVLSSGQTASMESANPTTVSPHIDYLEKEEVLITSDLDNKLKSDYNNQFNAPFYCKLQDQQKQQNENPHKPSALDRRQCVPIPTEKDWEWDNPSYVKLPFSKYNRWYNENRWDVIMKTLEYLKMCLLECKIKGDMSVEEFLNAEHRHDITLMDRFVKAVKFYNDKAQHSCNFKTISDDTILSHALICALPGIIDHALKLPGRLEKPIPILKRGQSQTLCLSRDLACSLLANAFLCTFPEQDNWRNLPNFNFNKLFNSSEDPMRTQVKREKLKCILDYFSQMSQEKPERSQPNSVITFERRCYPRKYSWAISLERLCPIKITANERLEETKGMLQVDFANKVVGGGVLNEGAVQEEIRFCISPELICARLFTQTLNNDEVLVITGSSQFSSYSGYSSSFKHVKIENEAGSSDNSNVDNLGRQFTQVVAMDALHFQSHETQTQYKPENIERELHKCNVAFTQGRHSTWVATGNWGCGAFNGDPQLKFLIQWMAASVHKRQGMLFHGRDEGQKEELQKMANLLVSKRVTVGVLYKIIIAYESKTWGRGRRSSEGISVFQFVEKIIRE